MTFRLRLVLIFLVPCGSGGSILSLWGLLGRTTQIRLIFCSVYFFISHCFQDTVPGSHEQSTISKKFKGLYLFNYLIELGETLYLAYLKDALFIQKKNKIYFFEILILGRRTLLLGGNIFCENSCEGSYSDIHIHHMNKKHFRLIGQEVFELFKVKALFH